MSVTLVEFAKRFVAGRVPVELFVEAYIAIWKTEGEAGLLTRDGPAVDECSSSIFCATDMYCGDELNRARYEIRENQLRMKVAELLHQFSLL